MTKPIDPLIAGLRKALKDFEKCPSATNYQTVESIMLAWQSKYFEQSK